MPTVTRAAVRNNVAPSKPSQRRRVTLRDPDWPAVAERVQQSHGNRQRCLLAELLSLAERTAEQYVADHPSGCDCTSCRYGIDGFEDVVQNIAWNARNLASMIEGEVLPLFPCSYERHDATVGEGDEYPGDRKGTKRWAGNGSA